MTDRESLSACNGRPMAKLLQVVFSREGSVTFSIHKTLISCYVFYTANTSSRVVATHSEQIKFTHLCRLIITCKQLQNVEAV